jgi:hypothetical protein
MSQPIVPQRQVRAFDLAMAKRLGLDPEKITDGFTASFRTGKGEDNDMAEVTFSGTAYLPADEVLAMFNDAGWS